MNIFRKYILRQRYKTYKFTGKRIDGNNPVAFITVPIDCAGIPNPNLYWRNSVIFFWEEPVEILYHKKVPSHFKRMWVYYKMLS